MRILGIIPARYNSSRFPGKPLVDIDGKSMIQRVYEQAKKCELLSSVFVATDDDRIFESVMEFGGQVKMTTEHNSGTERCNALFQDLKKEFDVVIDFTYPAGQTREILKHIKNHLVILQKLNAILLLALFCCLLVLFNPSSSKRLC